jgi:hypothetical protein
MFGRLRPWRRKSVFRGVPVQPCVPLVLLNTRKQHRNQAGRRCALPVSAPSMTSLTGKCGSDRGRGDAILFSLMTDPFSLDVLWGQFEREINPVFASQLDSIHSPNILRQALLEASLVACAGMEHGERIGQNKFAFPYTC